MDACEDSFQCQEFFAMVFDLQSNFSRGLKEKMKRKTITCSNEKNLSEPRLTMEKQSRRKGVDSDKQTNLKNKNQNKIHPLPPYTEKPTAKHHHHQTLNVLFILCYTIIWYPLGNFFFSFKWVGLLSLWELAISSIW